MKYPDTKDIVKFIYHNYTTRSAIIILQNKMIEKSNGEIMAWCDECWLNDFAEDLKSAFESEDFTDIDEDMVPTLVKEYESENIIELTEDYFYHNQKIIRVKYHPDTPNTIDSKILHAMEEERKTIDADYEKVRDQYESLINHETL